MLGDEDRGDQEARQDEEEVDAEVAAAERAVRVEEEHAEHGEAAEAVECGKARNGDARGHAYGRYHGMEIRPTLTFERGSDQSEPTDIDPLR